MSKGQFLERSTLVQVGSVALEALSHRGEARPPLLILSPTPESGGGMDHVLCAEAAWAAAMAGHPTLRFNFRGVGASQGKRGNGRTHLEDAEAACRALEENAGTPEIAIATVGASAQVALELAARHPALSGLCLIAPERLEVEDLLRLELPLCVVVAQQDTRLPRAALAASLGEQGARLELIEGADASFTRGLPQVGKAVVRFLRDGGFDGQGADR